MEGFKKGKIFIVILFLINCGLKAQFLKVVGKVTNEVGEAIPYATVYIDATSYGTTTNESGEFDFKLPNSLKQVTLIVSMVGFETKTLAIESKLLDIKPLLISLKTGIELAEATVEAKMDRFWRKKWRIFQNGLLGEVSPLRNFEFENKEFIKLAYDSEEKFVLATATNPFYIYNETLGYKIKVDLQFFKSDGFYTQFSAYKFFEENLSVDKIIREKQIESREKTYYSTIRYFLVSLKENRLAENKFEVYKINKMNQVFLGKTSLLKEVSEDRLIPLKSEDIYSFNIEKQKHYLRSESSLLVFNKNFASFQGNPFSDYYYEFSRIDLPKYVAEFNENGYVIRPNGMTLYYHWSKEGLGKQLPENYLPSNIQLQKSEIETPTEVIEIAKIDSKGLNLDSLVLEEPKSMNQLVTFNKTENEETEPDYFYQPDVGFKLTSQDANQSIFQLLQRVQSLRVVLNNESGEYDIFLQGSNTSLMSQTTDLTPNLVINNRVFRTKQEVMDQLLAIDTRQVKEIGLIKYGGGTIFGANGGNGTIVILMNEYKNAH